MFQLSILIESIITNCNNSAYTFIPFLGINFSFWCISYAPVCEPHIISSGSSMATKLCKALLNQVEYGGKTPNLATKTPPGKV